MADEQARKTASAVRYEFDDIPPSQWNRFARLPTQRHCWARACLETINARDEACLLISGNALAPFIIKRADPYRLAFIGDFIPEPHDVLSDSETDDGLAETIAKTGLAINLKRVPADATIINALQRAYRGRGSIIIKPRLRGCPFIELDDTWREPEQHFTANWRSNLRRMQRKAQNIGHVTFDIIAPQPTNVSALVKEAIAVEAAGWKRAAGTAIAVSRWRSAFYSRFAAYAAQEGILRLCFMRISGKVAAMQYAVECNERFFDHKIGYDETFGSCSPGTLLKLEVLRYAAERGLRSYEFQGTDAPWTYFWTKFVRPMVSLKAYPANELGLWLSSHDKLNVKRRTPKKKSK